ncbi:MgtC/SapB family protein [Rhodanobacter denitrificans]|uniref:Putative membrane protein n=1 Tax=Rhodanobacter denitrificans TaxID=666685 RepID=M4NAX9_9GAMM|nr:MgtC/SapB family protein [Rhodanobacter denitrificans]AGG87694.1 putative membrane protein [Rhodanobacter denitrificans]UJM86864.1 MgtC/SapB family protein [Rhodanobacter denitrificans]
MDVVLSWTGFAVALGIGLLIGAERERRKGGDGDAVAGIRTFAVVALLGAVGASFGITMLLLALAAVAALLAIAYARDTGSDRGLTTEVSLLLCLILGAVAIHQAPLAAGLAVAVTILLAAREPMHHFVRGVLTAEELNNLLVLAAATLLVLPLVPDRPLGPFDAINPRALWLIVILIMSIGAAAHTLLRLVGSRVGLPLAGLLSGFVSSVATIGVMGSQARSLPALRRSAVAAAVLSTVATFVQMAAVLAVTDLATLRVLAVPLACGGVTAAVYGVLWTWKGLHLSAADPVQGSVVFSVRASLLLGLMIAVVLLASAAMRVWLGDRGLAIATGVAGFADTHAAAVSVASLAAAGRIEPAATAVPILIALTSNSLSKAVIARTSGGRDYARPVLLGLAVVLAATWLGWWLG